MSVTSIADIDIRETASALGTVMSYRAGDTIFREGDPARHMYIVLEGIVEITSHGRTIETIMAGNALGIVSLIDGLTRSANAVATTEDDGSFTLQVPSGTGLSWQLTHPDFVTTIAQVSSSVLIPIVSTRDYDDLLGDLRGTLREVARDWPGLPLFLLGHSNGGQVAVRVAADPPVPLAGLILAEMGARVVRIGRPGNCDLIPIPAEFDLDLHGREVLTVDMKRQEGRDLLIRLIARSDVLLEGYRPGVMERLGAGPDEAMAANPRLVYGRMTGYGRDGPLAASAGHDLTYLAYSGVLHAIGPKSGKEVPLGTIVFTRRK